MDLGSAKYKYQVISIRRLAAVEKGSAMIRKLAAVEVGSADDKH